jgi:hypothetical protein
LNRIEEINVAYVGITRAKTCLLLPIGTRQLFTKQWQDYASSIPIISEGDASRKNHLIRMPSISVCPTVYSPQSKNSYRDHTEKVIEQRNVLPELIIGDKVLAPNGYGKVARIEGDQYLIDMENQTAQIWERRSSLVRVQIIRTANKSKKLN